MVREGKWFGKGTASAVPPRIGKVGL